MRTISTAKRVWVRKTHLSEFLIKIRGGGELAGGEFECVWKGEDGEKIKFSDVNDLIKLIEEQCDGAGYPQQQRKLRDWETKN